MATERENRPVDTSPDPSAPAPSEVAATEGTGSIDWESRFKYLLADFDNFRRRSDRERAGIRADAEAGLLRRLIPLVEGLQQAETSASSVAPSDPLRRGLELLGHELDAFLRSVGFSPVARVGQPFRPEEHEAVGETPESNDVADGGVAEIVQQGYRFQGGLLRPAKVLVARAAHEIVSSANPPPEPSAKEPLVEDESDGAA